MKILKIISLSILLLSSVAVFAEPETKTEKTPVVIGFDGEFGFIGSTSAEAISQGIPCCPRKPTGESAC